MPPPRLADHYNLFVDASDHSCGGVLTQRDENGLERPVIFISRKFRGAELRWPVTHRELFAAVYSAHKLHAYL